MNTLNTYRRRPWIYTLPLFSWREYYKELKSWIKVYKYYNKPRAATSGLCAIKYKFDAGLVEGGNTTLELAARAVN